MSITMISNDTKSNCNSNSNRNTSNNENDTAEAAPKQRVMEFLYDLIGKSFPMLHRSQVEIFVLQCFTLSRDAREFQEHMRDFLITLREWGSHEDALYEDDRRKALDEAQSVESQLRMQVPGLVPQYDSARASEMDDI